MNLPIKTVYDMDWGGLGGDHQNRNYRYTVNDYEEPMGMNFPVRAPVSIQKHLGYAVSCLGVPYH